MSSSDEFEEEIGQAVERTLPSKRRWTKRLPMARRQEAIELKLLGKEDPEYHVIEREKKGSYIVRKRARPLQIVSTPTVLRDTTPQSPIVPINPPVAPIAPNPEPIRQDIPVLSYFNNQNPADTSISNELKKLQDMYERLEEKYVEVKKTLKNGRSPKLAQTKPVAPTEKTKARTPVKQSKSSKPIRAQTVKQSSSDDSDFEPTEEEIAAYQEYLRAEEAKKLAQQAPTPSNQRQYRRRVIDINKF
jgi:hypothetical protein